MLNRTAIVKSNNLKNGPYATLNLKKNARLTFSFRAFVSINFVLSVLKIGLKLWVIVIVLFVNKT